MPDRGVGTAADSGPLRFARYAYPPNALGYCGPDAAPLLLEHTARGADDADLRRLLRGFEGAWPYLELIATANGLRDPLDARVVEAYWVGNVLLDRVGPRLMGDSVESRFRGRTSLRSWSRLAEVLPTGAVPHHSFHVLAVYPWVGLLRGGHAGDEPLRVMDRCRVRWGQVLTIAGPVAVVRSRPLAWDGRRLTLAAPVDEPAVLRVGDRGLAGALRPGDWCSLHWDWVCERLDGWQVATLRRRTLDQLAAVNGTADCPV
ncbi:DUF6390 family protein [Nocardioides sp. T2.26MG-1]|uniref:DUF6390 family protein n=1 Tax=Nocardioides sp. T2.26MG-1 TaxID=3041166 RepID=UPI0024772F1F|nr:DUF6390 family protein [Nocardioides sp. T2.26MG-1]CAI9404151.1 hypothetical protein HIDPHFAB_04122 [Nocardioides sp. T2.26MG-1]